MTSSAFQLILAAWGMPKGYIDHTVSAMIDRQITSIFDWRKTGGIVFDGPITVVSDLPALALVDGGRGLDIQWVHSAWHWPLIRPRKLELVRLQFVHLITLGLPDITPEWRLNII